MSIKVKSKKKVNWKELWKSIERVRSFKGKNKMGMSMSEFIAWDREHGHFEGRK